MEQKFSGTPRPSYSEITLSESFFTLSYGNIASFFPLILFCTVDMKNSEKAFYLPYKALKRSKIGSLSANSSRILIFSNLSIGSEEMKLYKFK